MPSAMKSLEPKEVGSWRPPQQWFPRTKVRTEEEMMTWGSKERKEYRERAEVLVAIAELYDYGYRVETIMNVFGVDLHRLLYAVRRYAHKPYAAERFAAVDMEGTLVARMRATERGLKQVPSGIDWSEKCSHCGSRKADGICVTCRARIESLKASKGKT